jgi:RNA polymerase sigma-70 factor, ECF subfamily
MNPRNEGPPNQPPSPLIRDPLIPSEHSRRHTRARFEPTAFRNLISEHKNRVYGYLVKTGVDAATRDDLFQEVWINIHRGGDPGVGPIKSWILTITANTVRSHFRKQKVRSFLSFNSEVSEQAADANPSADARSQARETLNWVEAELKKLPVSQREVLVLVATEGLNASEAAEILGKPVNTVKTLLRRGRATLIEKRALRQAREAREVSP